MKRYIKSTVQECPTLLDWLKTYRSSFEIIYLFLIDDNKRISINGCDGLLVCDLLRYLTNTNVSRFSNYLVVDAKVLGVVAGDYSYAVYIVPPKLI